MRNSRCVSIRAPDKGLRVWFAPEDQGREEGSQQLDEAIRLHDKLLLILSPESMVSEWVRTEIRKARKAEVRLGNRKLFPIRRGFRYHQRLGMLRRGHRKGPGGRGTRILHPGFLNWRDQWLKSAFKRLLKDLKPMKSTC